MATEDSTKTLTVDYGRDNATPTPYSYLKGGGLQQKDRDALAAEYGGKADNLDFRVVEDNIGHTLTVEVSPKAKEPAAK